MMQVAGMKHHSCVSTSEYKYEYKFISTVVWKYKVYMTECRMEIQEE